MQPEMANCPACGSGNVACGRKEERRTRGAFQVVQSNRNEGPGLPSHTNEVAGGGGGRPGGRMAQFARME